MSNGECGGLLCSSEEELTYPFSLEYLDFFSAPLPALRAHNVRVFFLKIGYYNRFETIDKSTAPLSERTCIMGSNVCDGVHHKLALRTSLKGFQ